MSLIRDSVQACVYLQRQKGWQAASSFAVAFRQENAGWRDLCRGYPRAQGRWLLPWWLCQCLFD
jgi:hypothetical protein